MSTSIGRVLHTQQGVRSLLKSMTSRHHFPQDIDVPSTAARTAAAPDASESAGAKLLSRHGAEGERAADRPPVVIKKSMFDSISRHPQVAVTCGVCGAEVPSTTCDYIFNHTLNQKWMSLCSLCYVSLREKLDTYDNL